MKWSRRVAVLFDEVPLFVIVCSVITVFETTAMWFSVPTVVPSHGMQQELLMTTVIDEDGVIESSAGLSVVIAESLSVAAQLDNDPESWQRTLSVDSPCSRFTEMHQTNPLVGNLSRSTVDHQFLKELADRAIIELELTSIMTGNKSLANISGRIYQQGDQLLLPSAAGSFLIKEVTPDSVRLEMMIHDEELRKEFGSIERVLFLVGSAASRFASAGDDE